MPGHPCEVLRFPPPYRAALAVSSDIDRTTPDYFERLHGFLEGLGLDIADSFWFYNANPESPGQMSYFAGTDGREKDAPLIRAGVAAGRIDALHAYGDFSLAGGFRRELAERAVRAGVRVPVWINHGDDHNFQNVLVPGTYGDAPEKLSASGWPSRPVEYHADLSADLGIRFVWAGDLTRITGQERPAGAWEHYRAHREGTRAPAGAAWVLDRASRLAGGGVARRALRRGIEYLGYPVWEGNGLLWLDTLRDGRPVWRFRRHGDFRKDCVEDLADALSAERLERLVSSRGASVLFTHFGKSRAERGAARELPAEVAEAFRRLAAFRDAGRLWVVRTSRLLRHLVVLRRLSARREGNALLLGWRQDPVLGDLGSPEDLADLAVRAGPGIRRVLSDGRELPAGSWRLEGEGASAWVGFPAERR